MNYEQEIKKLETQIENAEARIKELEAAAEAKQEVPPVWVPDRLEVYYTADINGATQYRWCHDEIDKYCLKMGNLFKTKQEAENHTRVLKLIETIRRERFKAQGNWWPSEDELRYIVRWYQPDKSVGITHSIWSFFSSVFGLWQDSGALIDVIEKHEPELKWYFAEYLPSIN